jgi:ornithine cyclodeaminase/alanine dehydrogenase-like protein (mu-crystallin family)
MPTDLLVLTASDVERALSSLDVPALLSLMAGVFARLSDASMPARLSVPTAAHTALVMPARAPPHGTAIKVVSVPRDPADGRGLPASTLVLDDATGGVRALINARALTAVRTAAGAHASIIHPSV